MKKITFLFAFLITSLGYAQVIFDFEGAPPTFNDFNGSFTQVIANPDATGINTSANVAENTVPASAAFAGVNIPFSLDITTAKGFIMDVWSPLPNTPVLLKLENSVTGVNVERQANTTAVGAWEELTFDFGSEGALTFDSITVFMNFNVIDPNTQVYYWDNLEQFVLPPSLPFNFEGQALTFNDFNGSFTQVIANPDPTGVNPSANVAENTVPGGAAFAGVNIPVDIDISTEKGFIMDVWSPLVGTPVLLKLENSVTGVNVERQVNMTTTAAWEELTFDFGSEGALTFDSVTVFMNFNVIDPSTQVYYWDNLEQFDLGTPPVSLPFNFEGGQTLTFNDFNGSFTQVIANPDATGVNTSANVAENTVPSNAAFAGVNIPVAVDISVQKGFIMDVWSPLAGTPVLLKLENSVTGVNVERQVNMTATNAWEELTFDFSTEGALTFDSVTIFMNFNVVDPNTNIFYWDNLEQFDIGATVVELPFDFEGTPPLFNDFNGSFTQVIANPDPTGVNPSANVAENTVPSNAAFAGVNIPVTTDVDITVEKGFRMDVWSPLAGTPVLLKLENSVTGVNVERQVNMTTTNAWEEITFDFSTEGGLTFNSITVFMNFNVVDPNTNIFYWDNLEQFNFPATLPIDFEGNQPPLNDFNGSFTQVIANPDASGINTSANVAENTVPSNAAFAGVNIPVTTLDISVDKGFIMDVWSPLADLPVLLKLENSVTGVNVERLVNMTQTNAWEELTFDFSSEGDLTFDSVTVFMNFNVVDPNTNIFYWDNLEQINIIIPPANDLCENAVPINCGDMIMGTTIDATDDTAAAPDCDTTTSAPGVWYVFDDTSGFAADIFITTCSANTDYDTKISVYTGDCGAPPLTCVVGNDDDPNCTDFQSSVSFQSDGATTYYILVHGFSGATGNFELSMTCDFIPPTNDAIGNSIDVDELGCPYTDTNVALQYATVEGDNPSGCNIDGANGVWYNITPESDGVISAAIASPAGASFVNFFTAPDENASVSDLVLVDWFDNQCAPSTSTTIPVTGGQAYYIYVVNTGGASDVTIDCDLLSVDENNLSNIQTFPNPVDSKLNVQANDPVETITVYSILGQKLMDKAPDATSVEVDMSILERGVYLVVIATERGTKTVRILKN
ncbi:T9SS type A sorting domain-containing protein [Aureisphaera galaxeae]|uniref:T9SS type A sorting domain-containing protein n=1 Tax=Aureisphaera galaxeae TaxID=1538023 RepID=UPI0023500903|nr:T9SS type A sorting domain-containing protein [Aureisphaera galaxeae]MDC8005150.1 T9SS type A sorting domain-containing protein [Aureisphaera galaxeae]